MIKPLKERALVKMIDYNEKSRGGIILKESMEGGPKIAEVIEVSDIKQCNDNQECQYVEKGDKVILNRFDGTEINYEGNTYIIIKQSEILAVIK